MLAYQNALETGVRVPWRFLVCMARVNYESIFNPTFTFWCHERVLSYVHFTCADLDAGRQPAIQRSGFGVCTFQPECFVS